MKYLFEDGLYGTIEKTTDGWRGQIAFVEAPIQYSGTSEIELKEAFVEAVVNYLSTFPRESMNPTKV